MVDQMGEKNLAHLPAEIRELLARVEGLDRSEDLPARITLLKRLLKLVPRESDPLARTTNKVRWQL